VPCTGGVFRKQDQSFTFGFHLAVTPYLTALGIGWALGIGVISGLFPAVRAARMSVAIALRAT
jgi:putative ABC transport system permease protein